MEAIVKTLGFTSKKNRHYKVLKRELI
jgi:hypothetical protein